MIIDFHSHILPGMDDGSDSPETSLRMLSEMKEQGVDLVVASSHFYARHDNPDNFVKRRTEAFEALKEAAGCDLSLKSELYPQVRLGCELAFFYGIDNTDETKKLVIDKTNVLMVEMPFSDWGEYEIRALSNLIFSKEFRVIIAHYERYESFVSRSIENELFRLPVYIQINSSSLCDRKMKKKLLSMFDAGAAKLLGSDSHNMDLRKPDLSDGRNAIKDALGETVLARIDAAGEYLILPNKA